MRGVLPLVVLCVAVIYYLAAIHPFNLFGLIAVGLVYLGITTAGYYK